MVLCPEAPSKDAVRDVCVQSHRGPSRRLTETTAAALSIPAAQAAQVTHRLSESHRGGYEGRVYPAKTIRHFTITVRISPELSITVKRIIGHYSASSNLILLSTWL